MGGLALALAAFVGTHFLMSHPLRELLVRGMGERAFQGFYSLIALVTLGVAIWIYGRIGDQTPYWVASDAGWILASLLMWFGSILLVGSFVRNPALPGARLEQGMLPHGVFAITRHPMMWGFAIWAIVHLIVVATPKSLLLDGAILVLALAGSVGQDRKKAARMGERFHEWTAQTAFVPFTRGLANPGMVALVGGTLLFLLATWLHPMPAGFWRWIG
ncbi:MFS transporter [Sphingomonas lutea]|uniref:MFS transporter n=1 Tax=Sphingomonas lutea TaxID=1045317 RepID=A0A7G9SL87_9SPHN|nr:NnrU family protein [Sphingomonas lutea]QNN68612.1 MFS transporter [Sphingomonas lutea]